MNEVDYVLSLLASELQSVFNMIDSNILNRITEIRLRRDKPVVIVIKNTSYFIDYNGDLYDYMTKSCVMLDGELFDKSFMQLCDYSIYSNMENLKNGFITLANGSRIGVASTAVFDDTGMISVKEISALNIRIPRAVCGCSENILNFLYINSFPSIIVAGKPNSGKTTLLRDMARELSSGFNNIYRKIALIDERNEFGAKNNSDYSLDVGINTDVLTAFNKAKGIELATRTLSPEMIICDEISTDDEINSILYAFSSGISFALSVHIGSKQDLYDKPIIRKLLETNEFSYVVLLDNYTYKLEIIEGTEILNEINRDNKPDTIFDCNRITFI